MVSAVFARVAAPRTKPLLWSKSSRNLGSTAKISLQALPILTKLIIEFLGINVRRFCGSMALIFISYALEVCVWVKGKQLKPFHVGVGLRQECVLLSLLFIVYMNWINKCSPADEYATIGNCKVSRLLFRWWFGSAFFHRIWPPARIK